MLILAVVLGGALGAPCRFLLDRAVSDRVERDFPVGTFTINVSGSLVLGLLTGLDLSGHLSLFAKTLLGTGFCGAYTTFSTWSYETVELLSRAEYLQAGLNVLFGLGVGIAAAALGVAIGLHLR